MATVCAIMLAENEHAVRLWSAFPKAAEILADTRQNTVGDRPCKIADAPRHDVRPDDAERETRQHPHHEGVTQKQDVWVGQGLEELAHGLCPCSEQRWS